MSLGQEQVGVPATLMVRSSRTGEHSSVPTGYKGGRPSCAQTLTWEQRNCLVVVVKFFTYKIYITKFIFLAILAKYTVNELLIAQKMGNKRAFDSICNSLVSLN